MPLEVVETCPLGHTCEETRDGKIYRCAWYQKLYGKDPQSEKVLDEWRCAMGWMPLLMTEVSMTNRGQTHALEDFRNHMVGQQVQFNGLMHKAVKRMSGGDQRLIDVDGDDSSSD